jgi:hypothetical protein
MTRHRILLVGVSTVLVVLLIGAGVVWLARPKPAVLRLDISGPAGMPITGTCDVDGATQELTGVVPKQFVLKGYRVTFSLATTADSGDMHVKAAVDDQVYGSLGSNNPPKNGVRGWVKSNWYWYPPTNWIEPFPIGGQSNWLNPPP